MRSIWDSTDRAAFEKDVAALHTLAPSQIVPKDLRQAPGITTTDPGVELPNGLEKQFAKDLAFLAAWQSTPGCVAAATIQHKWKPNGLRVVIAANEGIAPEVSAALEHIFELVEEALEDIVRSTMPAQDG
ncbi:hypothetical protein LTR36_006891 [Oleoguttula mirabilis]|uniref:Uncharacterized protein n=1 Tax=Oleoguttula mirabilis TaxID=1507867 RepID=A0AAV9JBD0_9PEZI|nr:hypothetical protein LTR36_006891 [Oleoguttula mirabilis]